MFSIGWQELMIVAVVGFVLAKPEDLPSIMRFLGRTIARLKAFSNSIQQQINTAMYSEDGNQKSEIRSDENDRKPT